MYLLAIKIIFMTKYQVFICIILRYANLSECVDDIDDECLISIIVLFDFTIIFLALNLISRS